MGGAESRQRVKPYKPTTSHLADKPSVPGKPQLVPSDKHSAEPDVVTIRWDPPQYDGGSRITGYLVEHRRTGSPHWVRSSPSLVRVPELTLSGLEPGWRYQFRVSAQNAAGLSEPGELSDLLTVTLQRTAATAPFFVKELKDTVALENEKAELVVQARGTPTPTFSWFKDGVEVFSSRSYRIVTDNDTSTLVIHQAALSDEGEIKCSATNRVGYAVTRAKLVIEAPPSIRLPRQYEEGLLFEKDEVIRLKVSVAGRPVPRVSWQLNGEPVPGGGRYEDSHSERYATLRVGEARRTDRGEYQVRAVNKLGEDVASFLVTVADRPMPPGRAKVVMTLGRSVTLSWTVPDDDGGCKIGNYIVEYYRLGWNMWLKAATCRQLTTTLGELIEGSEYKFRVKAENPYGVSDPSAESDVVFIPDPKRGLLEPPEHGKEKEVTMDVWLEDKKRSPSPSIDEQYGERKTKKKRGPMASSQSQRPEPPGRKEKHSMMSEDSMSPPPTPEGYRPVIPKRRNKVEKIDIKKELQEEEELQRKLDERRKVEEFKRFEERKAEEFKRAEERRKAEEMKKKENKKGSAEIKKKGNKTESQEMKKKDNKKEFDANTKKEPLSRQLLTPSVERDSQTLTPRVEHDHFHGSSELMLVLLPHSPTTEEREMSKRELFESNMALEGDDIAPPMSLSAPELGSGDPPELPLVRSAFSSTELLHERAMARFYQDMAKEEAETSLKRRSSLQRRRSFGSRTRDIPEVAGSLQDIVSSAKSLGDKVDRFEKLSSTLENKSLTRVRSGTLNLKGQPEKKTFSRDSMDSMLSSEDPHRKPVLVQQTSEEDMEYEDSSFDEDEEDEYDEDDEELGTDDIDEEVEEELEEEEDDDDEDEDEFSNDEKRGTLYTSESEEEFRSYSMEEDTYHPRVLVLKDNEDTMISAYEGRGPLILGSVQKDITPSPTPKYDFSGIDAVKSQPFPSHSDVKAKPILKRPGPDTSAEMSSEPSDSRVTDKKSRFTTSPEKRFEPNFSAAMPKPILKVREPSQEKYSPVSQRKGAPVATVEPELNLETSNRTTTDDTIEHETGVKKKQVRIEEPEDVVSRGLPERRESDVSVLSGSRFRHRTGSLDEETDETKVLISHYSDIVAEFGRVKRAPKTLYLDYESLKAAAEKEEETTSPHIPEIVVYEPESEEVKKEPQIYQEEVKENPQIHQEEGVKENLQSHQEEQVKLEEIVEPEKSTNYFDFFRKRLTPKREKPKRLPKEKSPSPEKIRPPSPRKLKRSVVLERVQEETVPEKIEYARTPSPALPLREFTATEKKVHSYFDFLMDFSLFLLACWLYLFKDERLSIPVLCLMIYRQAYEAFQRKMEALKNKLPRRMLFWRRKQ